MSGDPGPADRRSLKLDSPLVVQWEYASEERLAARNAVYRQLIEGDDAEQVLFERVRDLAPGRVLDVGCGMGELAERFARELGADVQAVDLSQRMVELTQSRGVDARVADVQRLPFEDARFDCVVAAWVLYHLPDLTAGLAELDRVLRPGGHVVAATVGERNLGEVWDLVGGEATRDLSFGPDNGEEVLGRHFAAVERVDAEGTLVFPDTDAVRKFVAMTITRAHLARDVPPLAEPLRARTSHVIFVATKAP